MNSIRLKRLSNTYMEEISKIIMEEIKDEDVKKAVITGVDVTNDLSYAKVYFTVLDRSEKGLVFTALNGASGFIRKCLADRIEIRNTPELKFIYDDSEEYGEKIDKIIEDINKDEK